MDNLNNILFINTGGGIGDALTSLPTLNYINQNLKPKNLYYFSTDLGNFWFDTKLQEYKPDNLITVKSFPEHFGFRDHHMKISKDVIKNFEIDEFIKKCNMAMVEIDILKRANLNDDFNEELIDKNLLDFDEIRLKKIIQNHVKMTSSVKGKNILSNWDKEVSNFKKVMPTEFKRVLTSYKKDNMSKVAGE